jgi:hypothetical protein
MYVSTHKNIHVYMNAYIHISRDIFNIRSKMISKVVMHNIDMYIYIYIYIYI